MSNRSLTFFTGFKSEVVHSEPNQGYPVRGAGKSLALAIQQSGKGSLYMSRERSGITSSS